MEQNHSWEAKSFSASQDILRILWNPKIHYHFHKSSTTVHILSQIYPVHAPPSEFLKTHFNIIILSTPGSSKWFLTFRTPNQNLVCTSPLHHTCYMPRPFHSSWLDHPKNPPYLVRGTVYESPNCVVFSHSVVPRLSSATRLSVGMFVNCMLD